MKTLYIFRGHPGVAKSELAKVLCPDTNIAADDYPDLYNADGSFNAFLLKPAHEWCLWQVKKMMFNCVPAIAVHNTFIKLEYLEPYLEIARIYGYSAHVIHSEGVILPNGERTQNTHNVPVEVIARFANSFEPLPTGYEKYAND